MDKVKASSKGHNDFVTSVDKKAEQFIIDTIHAAETAMFTSGCIGIISLYFM